MRRRVPVRIQASQTECGLAASLAVLAHHGRYQSVAAAREVCQPGRDGLSIAEIRYLLEHNGCRVKVFRAGSDRLAELELPVIVFWRNYHFLVLERIRNHVVDVMDPETGRRTLTREDFDQAYSQLAIAAVPGDRFITARKAWLHEWRLPGLHWNVDRAGLAIIAVITLCTYVLTLALPILTARAIDLATSGGIAMGWWWNVVLIVLACAGGFVLAEVVRTAFTSVVVRRLGSGLMAGAFGRLLRLRLSFFSTRAPGELMQRLGSVNYVRDCLSNRIVQSVFDGGMTAVILGYIWFLSPTLGGLASVMVMGLVFFLMLTHAPLARAMDQEINALTLAQGVQYDAISGIAQLKMGGYQADMERRWRREYDRSLVALHRRMMWQMGLVGSVCSAFTIFGPITLLLSGLQLHAAGVIGLGETVAVLSLASMMFSGTTGLLAVYTDVLSCSRYLLRLEDIMVSELEPEGGSRTRLDDGVVEVRGLEFRYANEAQPVLHGLDFSVADGELAAVVGQSGSGKSTLAKILCGMYEPTAGEVLIGGHPLSEYRRSDLRRQIGYVPQEVTLHNGTILENLRMGSEMAEDDVVDRCRALGFLDFVDELPMGYRTLVADLGANFSGGQRQRLAIARVLLRSPRILIFDEATSALDRINEQRVNAVLRHLGCTRIVIAHRLETVQYADTIHVADRGSLVERGTHDTLLTHDGAYAELYREGVPA